MNIRKYYQWSTLELRSSPWSPQGIISETIWSMMKLILQSLNILRGSKGRHFYIPPRSWLCLSIVSSNLFEKKRIDNQARHFSFRKEAWPKRLKQGSEMFESIYNHMYKLNQSWITIWPKLFPSDEDAHDTEKATCSFFLFTRMSWSYSSKQHSYKKLKMCIESNRPILRNVVSTRLMRTWYVRFVLWRNTIQPVDPVEREFCYVDEHTCIGTRRAFRNLADLEQGCTNCAMIARNTFFMEER